MGDCGKKKREYKGEMNYKKRSDPITERIHPLKRLLRMWQKANGERITVTKRGKTKEESIIKGVISWEDRYN